MISQVKTQDIRYVRSDRDPSRFYMVALNSRGFWECECPAARFNRAQPCKHTRRVAKEGAGLVATPKQAPAPRQPSEAVRDLADSLQI
jgi:hypothetical protein